MRRTGLRIAMVGVGALSSLALSVPASATAASTTGPGTVSVDPSQVPTSSTGNTLTFTYTAAFAGVKGGSVTIAVPTDWTAPQRKNTDNPGFVTASKGRVVIKRSVVWVKNLKVCGGCFITVTYEDAAAPGIGESSTFQSSAAAHGRKVGPLAPQPTVTVTSGGGL